MTKVVAIATLLIVTPTLATSQTSKNAETPRLELFGGYSYMCANIVPPPGFTVLGRNVNGWDASAYVNLNSWLGIVADISGHYGPSFDEGGFITRPAKKDVNQYVYTFLFGPRVSIRRIKRLIPFAHALFGTVRVKQGIVTLDSVESSTDAGFAMALGGGVDIKLQRRIAIRAVQAEYLQTRVFHVKPFADIGRPGHDSENNIRLSTGVVFYLSKD